MNELKLPLIYKMFRLTTLSKLLHYIRKALTMKSSSAFEKEGGGGGGGDNKSILLSRKASNMDKLNK
jgi:hypothetical protein